MHLISYLHFFAFISYVFLAIYLLAIRPKSLLNVSCASFVACLAIWSLQNAILQSTWASLQTANIIVNIGVFGWVGFGGMFLWFVHVLTGQTSFLKRRWHHLLVVVPAVVIIGQQWRGGVVAGFIQQPYGWAFVFPPTFWPIAYCFYYLVIISVALVMLMRFAQTTSYRLKRIQAGLMFWLGLACFVAASVSHVLLPMLGIYALPALGNVIALFWALGLSWAIVRHEMLRISPAMAADNIIATMSDLLVLTTPQGRIVTINQAGLDLLGLERRDVENQSIDTFIHASSTLWNRLRKKFGAGPISNQRIDLKTASGALIPAMVSGSILTDKEGGQVGMVFVAKDITPLVKANSQKQELEARLHKSQKMEAIGTLAGGVAHDLNNILSGIVSYPELLLLDLPHNSPLEGPLRTIKSSGEKAAALVQDLLTLARRNVSAFEPLDLNRVIRGYVESPEHKHQQAFYPLTTVSEKLDPNLSPIKGSKVHLTKTIMNLVNNAFEAMPEGGNITIYTQHRRVDRPISGFDDIIQGSYAVLSVMDEGVGIDRNDLDRIFEPFFTKKVMGRSGSGLGMAVVWGTVKDHEGYIDIRSVEGQGTVVELYFPVTDAVQIESEKEMPIAHLKGHHEAILVIDDVKEQRLIATSILRRLGYTADSVDCGEKAVDYLRRQPVDLLVLDMIMGVGMDGLDTYRAALEINPGQKAIIASGFSETERVRQALDLGATDYLKKPYTLQKIGLAVRTALLSK